MIETYENMRGKLPQQFKIERDNVSIFGDYVCDTVADLLNLPECMCGSLARIAYPAAIYRRSSSGEWVLQEEVKDEPQSVSAEEEAG